MASAKKRQEERTDLEWADDSDHNVTLHQDDDIDDDDDDDDVMYDDDRDLVSDAESPYDVIGDVRRAPPTSGQMRLSHMTDVYGPMALVQ